VIGGPSAGPAPHEMTCAPLRPEVSLIRTSGRYNHSCPLDLLLSRDTVIDGIVKVNSGDGGSCVVEIGTRGDGEVTPSPPQAAAVRTSENRGAER
jgi:hypothetical protein